MLPHNNKFNAFLGDSMIGSSSPINAIAIPKLDKFDENYYVNMRMLLYSGASDQVYKVDNYDVVSFCGSPSNMCISYASSFDHKGVLDVLNAISLRHGRKMLNINICDIISSALDYSEGKLVKIDKNIYLKAKYKFLTGDEITCLHEIKDNDLSNELGISYIKDITINNFHIDPKTIYYFITFLAEVSDGLISEGEYNLEKYYNDELNDEFEDLESLFNYIKSRYLLYMVRAVGNGILYIAIEYNRTSQHNTLFKIFVINQDGNPYMVSKIINGYTINVFYNVINKTAKVITYEPKLEYLEEYVLSDKGLIWTYLNNKGERLIFDANSLEFVPIGLKDTLYVNFSYEKEFDMNICFNIYNNPPHDFGLIYSEIFIPKDILFVYEFGCNVLYPIEVLIDNMYSGSFRIPTKIKMYELNKVLKYIMIKVKNVNIDTIFV